MKKIYVLIISLLLCTSLLWGCAYNYSDEGIIYDYNKVKDSLIRFHVIANSDCEEDQALKVKVKDKIIEYLYPYLNNSKSLEESRKILIDNEDKVKEIALKTISSLGYNYDVKIELSRENFPEKAYGSIILPQGNYEAFRVIIGNGSGQNWWCVMFPPLCFIDVTTGKVQDSKSIDELDKQIKTSNKDKKQDTKLKLKVVEVFKKYIK